MKSKALAAVILFCAQCLFAQSSPIPISLELAVKRAIEQSLSLQRGAIDLETASDASRSRWQLALPSLSLEGNAGYTGSPSGAASSGFRANVSGGLRLGLSAGLPAEMELVKKEFEASRLSYNEAARQITIAVKQSYYNLVGQRQSLQVLREMEGQANAQYRKDNAGYNAGTVSLLNRERSRLAAESARFDARAAETQLNAAFGAFLLSLGYEWGEPAELTDDIDVARVEIDTEKLLGSRLPQRPDVALAKAAVERAELAHSQAAWNGRAPALTLSGAYQGAIYPGYSDTLSGSVALSIPLDVWIPGSGENRAIKAAKAEVEKARLSLLETERNAKSEILSLASSLTGAWDSVEISRLRSSIAADAYRMTENGFNQGAVEMLDLIDARMELAEARRAELNAALAYKTTLIQLAAALNMEEDEL